MFWSTNEHLFPVTADVKCSIYGFTEAKRNVERVKNRANSQPFKWELVD